MSCSNLKELLEAERFGIQASCGHRRYLISKREHRSDPSEVDWEQAKSEWLSEKGDTWMEGFKFAYCHYACKNRETCDMKDLEINKWLKYTNGNSD